MGPLGRAQRGLDERGGRIGHVVEVRRPGEGDLEGPPEHGRLHRARRTTRHSLVAAHPVDGERADPHAGETAVLEVDARVPLVGALEDPVVRGRLQGRALVRRGLALGGPVDRGRAGVDDPLESHGGGGLEDVDGPEDVHAGPCRGIGLAEGHLEARQVDHLGDSGSLHRAAHRGAVGDVALDEVDPGQGLLVHEVPQPAGVAAQVEDDGAVAAIEDGLGDPRADAAEGARQEPGVAHALGGPLGPAEEPSVSSGRGAGRPPSPPWSRGRASSRG